MDWFKRKSPKPSMPKEHHGIPTVKFDTARVTGPVRAEVLNCVNQIEGLKPSEFDHVHEAALQCVSGGGDLHVLTVALLNASIDDMTKRKAGDIAIHLNGRARSIMDREKLLSLGIRFSEWIYSGAPCDPYLPTPTPEQVIQDATHAGANGLRYENAKGLLVNGKWTWPGWETGCKCTHRPIISGFD